MSKVGAERIVLVAHSMGNQLIDDFLRTECLNTEHKFKEIDFVFADVDASSFSHHAKRIAETASKVRVYINPKDKAIGTSAWLRNREARLGVPGRILKDLARKKLLDVIDVSELMDGKDGQNLGLLGHTVPFWLIANMERQNRPGDPSQYTFTEPDKFGYLHLQVLKNKKH